MKVIPGALSFFSVGNIPETNKDSFRIHKYRWLS